MENTPIIGSDNFLRVMIGTHWMPLPEPPGTEASDDEK